MQSVTQEYIDLGGKKGRQEGRQEGIVKVARNIFKIRNQLKRS